MPSEKKKEKGKSTPRKFFKNTEGNEKGKRPHLRQHRRLSKLSSNNGPRGSRLHSNFEMLPLDPRLAPVLSARISMTN